MPISIHYNLSEKRVVKVYLVFLCLWAMPAFGQIHSVTTVQHLSFGAFTGGTSGGTITVGSAGNRTATGSVTLLNMGHSHSQALFDVVAPSGTIILIEHEPHAELTSSHGGSMTLRIGSAETASLIIAHPTGTTRVGVGGTLTISDSAVSRPGTYTGTMHITFHHQ